MSAKGRGRATRKDEFYRSPPEAVLAVLPLLPVGAALDPCAGDGNILRVLRTEPYWSEFQHRGIELSPRRAICCEAWCRDALAPEPWGRGHPIPLVIMNPPFSLTEAFLRRALAEVAPYNGTVAMLQKVDFAATKGRQAFHREHKSDMHVIDERLSFLGNGETDNSEYAWWIFGPGRGGRWAPLRLPERSLPLFGKEVIGWT